MATTPNGRTSDITSEDPTLHSLLDRTVRWRMPDYQRRQAWNEDLIVEWLQDVEALSDDDVNYLGAIQSQVSDHFSDSPVADADVIDGQQRLIGVTATIACARDILAEEYGERTRANQLNDWYLHIATGSGTEPAVRLTELDDDAYQILLADTTASAGHPGLESLFQTIRSWMTTELDSADEVDAFVRKFLFQQAVTHTRIGPGMSGYKLFDSHNGQRSNLSPVDRIKTLIMATAESSSGVDKDIVEEAWYRIRRAVDRKNVSEVRFFRYWVMSNELFPVTDKVTKGTLFETVDEILRERLPASSHDLEGLMLESADAAELYRDIATVTVSRYSRADNEAVNYHLRRIDTIGANPARLLLLRALREEIDTETLVELLERLERFTFPRRVTDKRVPDEIRAFIMIAHTGFQSDEDLFEVVDGEFNPLTPSAAEFHQEFMRADWSAGKSTKYVLETLEGEYFNPTGGRFGGYYPNLEVDHIAPRKAFTAKKYAPWKKTLDVEEESFELLKEQIGNVTLFEESLNRKAGDDPFEEKCDLYESSGSRMAQEVANRSDWSAAVIDERSDMLADIAVRVWDL